MLSNLIISTQRTILIIDEIGQENISHKFLKQLLREQGQDESTIKTLQLTAALQEGETFDKFLAECAEKDNAVEQHKWNVLLPPLSDLLCYQRAAVVFQFLHKLRKCSNVKRTFLWASVQHIMHSQVHYVLAACEYLADLIVHLETASELSIIVRKPGGGVTNKRYTCKKTKTQFLVEPAVHAKRSNKEANTTTLPVKPEQMGTFKIELDGDELVARNALKLPYEKTAETTEGNIIYTPDAADDFDDEDPDEDLCI